MDNPETLASLDTQDTEWRQRTNKKTQKTKKMSNTESRPKTGGVLRCTCAAIHSDNHYHQEKMFQVIKLVSDPIVLFLDNKLCLNYSH